MRRVFRWRGAVVVAVGVLALGCGGGEGAEEATDVEPAAGGAAMDGLTPEQIRRQAEPMSPAVAESLGIVDTTIHIEDPNPGDTVRRPDTVPPAVRPGG